MSLARAISELAYAFGWTHEEILSLTLPLVGMYLRELGAIKQDENLMHLRIVTNPHIESKDQKELWRTLTTKHRPKRPATIDYQKEKEILEERLKRV